VQLEPPTAPQSRFNGRSTRRRHQYRSGCMTCSARNLGAERKRAHIAPPPGATRPTEPAPSVVECRIHSLQNTQSVNAWSRTPSDAQRCRHNRAHTINPELQTCSDSGEKKEVAHTTLKTLPLPPSNDLQQSTRRKPNTRTHNDRPKKPKCRLTPDATKATH
jgi:hypothetical protein